MEGLNQNVFRILFSIAHQNLFLDVLVVFLATYLPFLLVIGLLVFAFSRKEPREKIFIFIEGLLAAILSRSVITETIWFFYAHPRPYTALNLSPLVHVPGNSFPSGHAAILFSLATTLYYFDKRLGGWFFLLAFINGAARIVAGVHWPLDILGGMAVGIFSAIIAHRISAGSWEKMKILAPVPEKTDSAI